MRTSSQRISFWQCEVGIFDNIKMVELNDKYGPMGEAIFFRIMDKISDSEGYYVLLSDGLILSIYRTLGSKWIKNRQVISEVIHYCGVCGLFDVNLLSQNVITSRGIQRRWLYVKQKSRAKGFSTAKFWLLDEQELYESAPFSDKCNINDQKCNINTDNCYINSPYKEKISKEKTREDIVSKKEREKNIVPSYSEVMDEFGVDNRVKEALFDFIQHLRANKITVVNKRLEDIIVKLDITYGRNELEKAKEIRRSITNGFKRLPCEEID